MLMKIGIETKERCLKTIQSFIKNSTHGKLYESVMKFQNNKYIVELQHKYLKHILNSKVGKVIIGFSTWKSMPNPSNSLKNKLANKF